MNVFRGNPDSIWAMALYMMMGIFCFFLPILFYYVVYLMGVNIRRLQIGLSQKNYIDTQEQYLTQLMEMQDSLRKFQHDYKAHLFCIDNLLLEKNYEEAHRYLERMHEQEKTYDYCQVYTEDNRINVLLNHMAGLAQKQGICFTAAAKNVSVENIALYDLNMLLANLYSNAVEAAGCTAWQKIRYGILPQLMPNFASTAIYRFDIDLRDSTVLGLVGAGGIGAPLIFAMNSYRWKGK